MRPAPLLVLFSLLCGGCSRSAGIAPTPAGSAPVSEAVAVAPAESLVVCVLRAGRLTRVPVVRDPASGDTLYEGRRFRDAFPDTLPYAARQAWFVDNRSLEYRGRSLVRWGLPRVLEPGDVEPVGEYRGVVLFAQAGRTEEWDNVYVPVRPGCEFQWYKYTAVVRPVRG